MKTVGLYTLGCKVSQYETEAIAEEFVRQGFTVCDFDSVCQVYVINTCTVTAESAAAPPRNGVRIMGNRLRGIMIS